MGRTEAQCRLSLCFCHAVFTFIQWVSPKYQDTSACHRGEHYTIQLYPQCIFIEQTFCTVLYVIDQNDLFTFADIHPPIGSKKRLKRGSVCCCLKLDFTLTLCHLLSKKKKDANKGCSENFIFSKQENYSKPSGNFQPGTFTVYLLPAPELQ